MNCNFMFETMVNAMILHSYRISYVYELYCVKNLVIGLKLDQLLGTPNSLWLNMMTKGGLNIFKLI
jgi:hypothetical protein